MQSFDPTVYNGGQVSKVGHCLGPNGLSHSWFEACQEPPFLAWLSQVRVASHLALLSWSLRFRDPFGLYCLSIHGISSFLDKNRFRSGISLFVQCICR